VIPQLVPARQALLATFAYAGALVAMFSWLLASDGAYRELQALYNVKSEMLDGLKRRAPTDRGTNRSAVADLDAATIAAPSDTVAASALQRHLLDRLESAGGFVQSVQAEPRRETIPPGLQRLSAQLAFDASVAALQCFLFDLETAQPFVFVESLTVQPTTVVQPGGRAGERLRVTLTLTSYWKAGETAGADR
jgi:Type II secretion system (T2SS), protein M subtype b